MSGVAVEVQENAGVMKHQGLMSIKELAIYLGRSAGWVYVNKDSLPHRKIGRLYFFDKGAVDEWLRGERPVETKVVKKDPQGFADGATKRPEKKKSR